MNKFYKSIKLTAFILVLVSLAGCKKDVDVIGISDDLANKTMLGYYTYTSFDSTKMQTLKKEYFLERDNAGNQKGYFRENKSGNAVASDVTTPMTWEAVMAEDNLSMIVTATLQGGKTKSFKWADGIVYEDGLSFEKSVANLSNIEVQNQVYAQIDNVEFECSNTSYHPHTVAVDYLGWKTTTKKNVAAEDTAKVKQDLIDQMEQYHDTIVWFMKEKTASGYIGTYAHYVDTVLGGKDTTLLIDLAYVNPTPNPQGKFSILYLKSETKTENRQKDDQPSEVIYGNMVFNNVGNVKTATYKWQKSKYSLEHYLKPNTEKDSLIDSVFTMTATAWVVPSFTNQAKFDVLLCGSGDSIITETKAGVEKQKKIPMEGKYLLLPLSGYTEKRDKEGQLLYIEVTLGDLKYRKK